MNSQPSMESSASFRQRMVRRGIAICISVFSSFLLLTFGIPTWLFRDGLGPDSIESSGIDALRRFFSDFWPFALFCFVLFVIAFFVGRHRPPDSGRADNRLKHDS